VPLQTHNRHYNHCRGADQKYVKSADHIFVDRIDLQIEILPLSFEEVSRTEVEEPSSAIRERVLKARQIQEQRYANEPNVHCNAQMTPPLMRKYCGLDDKAVAMLKKAMTKLNLSARAYDRILRVSRTIADYDGEENVLSTHIAEAIGYRNLDRSSWGQG